MNQKYVQHSMDQDVLWHDRAIFTALSLMLQIKIFDIWA
jgi:hypothetical protein